MNKTSSGPSSFTITEGKGGTIPFAKLLNRGYWDPDYPEERENPCNDFLREFAR